MIELSSAECSQINGGTNPWHLFKAFELIDKWLRSDAEAMEGTAPSDGAEEGGFQGFGGGSFGGGGASGSW